MGIKTKGDFTHISKYKINFKRLSNIEDFIWPIMYKFNRYLYYDEHNET